MKATLIPCPELQSWTGDARLYRLDPPLTYDAGLTTEYVIVSAVIAPFTGAETMLFASDAHGVAGDSDVAGFTRGSLDHAAALKAAGYTIAQTAEK